MKIKEVEKLQAVRETVKDFCEPQVKVILEISQQPDNFRKSDFDLVKNQAHQLVQNYENLEKIVKYVEAIDEKRGKQLSKEWVETKQNLSQMDVDSIKNIEIKASNLE